MKFGIITLFPEFFETAFKVGVLRRAFGSGIIGAEVLSQRDFTADRHRTVDDSPFGGGAGMVLKPEPLAAAIREMKKRMPEAHVLALSPGGERLTDEVAERLSHLPALVLICGRYEGIDQRIIEHFCDGEISLGDFILTGGEAAAMAVVDAVARKIPGVVGKEENVGTDSFSSGLKYPVYTRPAVFEGFAVPEALLTGDQAAVDDWRRSAAVERTARDRPEFIFDAARERIAIVFEGFTADEALKILGTCSGRTRVGVFVSGSAAERKQFRDGATGSGASAADAKEADRKLAKILPGYVRIIPDRPADVALELTKTLLDGGSAAVVLSRSEGTDYPFRYFSLLVEMLFTAPNS